jgi:hypothetical protein
MATAQEIVRQVKRSRAELYRESGSRPLANCDRISKVVREYAPKSQLWESQLPTHHGDFLQHFVAIIGTRGVSGIIVQFSGSNPRDKEMVLGHVSDIHNEAEVRKELAKNTGRKGWIRQY